MQGPMELMKSWRLSPQRHVKSVVAHPTSEALLLKQPAAHEGNWETRSGSVEFWAAATAAKRETEIVENRIVAVCRCRRM